MNGGSVERHDAGFVGRVGGSSTKARGWRIGPLWITTVDEWYPRWTIHLFHARTAVAKEVGP